MFRQDFTCPALLVSQSRQHSYGAITRYGLTFQTVRLELRLNRRGWSDFARHYFRNLG